MANTNGAELIIRRALKRHKTPLLLIRRDMIIKQYRCFCKNLPEVTPYYAIKANPNPQIIKEFIKLGSNFDVASANEMKLVLSLGQ